MPRKSHASRTPLPLGPLVAICASTFVETTASLQLLPYCSFYVEHLSRNAAEPIDIATWTGVLFGCFSFASAVANPVWSMIAMRFGAGRTASMALVIQAFCELGFGFAPNLGVALACRILHGLCSGNWAMLQAHLQSLVDDTNQVASFGFFSAMYSLATCLGPLFGGALYGHAAPGANPHTYPASAIGVASALATLTVPIPLLLYFVRPQAATARPEDSDTCPSASESKGPLSSAAVTTRVVPGDAPRPRRLLDRVRSARAEQPSSGPRYEAVALCTEDTKTTAEYGAIAINRPTAAAASSRRSLSVGKLLGELVHNATYVRSVALYCALSVVFMSWEVVLPLWARIPSGTQAGAFGAGWSPRQVGKSCACGGAALTVHMFVVFRSACERAGTRRYWALAWIPPLAALAILPLVHPQLAKRDLARSTSQAHDGGGSLAFGAGDLAIYATQIVVSVGLGSCFPVVAMFINNAVTDVRLAPLANAMSQACVGLSRAVGPALCTVFFSRSFAAERGTPLAGPTLGRAGAFEMLVLLGVVAVFGGATLPSSVEKRASAAETLASSERTPPEV